MNLNKAQLLLEKVNRLYKSMSLDPENVASIEKDLMRDYIKQLYDAFLEEAITKPITRATAPLQEKTFPPRVWEQAPLREENSIPPPPIRERIIAPPPVVEEVITHTPQPAPVASFRQEALGEEYDQLFQHEESNELSHKLSSLPISDLHKAMGINERIFTINELFRGDSAAFKHTINTLNELPSFEAAKAYLAENVANEFDWVNINRKGKAKNFIKLVKRKYI